jgi:hypothetical protein
VMRERFVLSIKPECLNHVVPLGELHLRLLVSEYVAHYHAERHHEGLDNALIEQSNDDLVQSGCPLPLNIVAIDLGCHSNEKHTVKTTGPCTLPALARADSKDVDVQTTDAGTCHVELTFGSGAASSLDVKIVSRWRALGSDPHGCGQEFVGLTDAGDPCMSGCKFSLPERICDPAQ